MVAFFIQGLQRTISVVVPSVPKKNGEGFVTELQGLKNVILTPHIGGSTEEAQTDIGEFVGGKILGYLENGNTVLSVNLPGVSLSKKEKGIARVIHIHENVPKMLAQINSIFGEKNINIAAQQLKTNENIGLVVTDVEGKVPESVVEALGNIPHTILCRVI
jgi:D-3-phosphoglycerate dehydrogenase